ncbi:Uncharacterized protein DAT39_013030, partial [Clarias magur]
MHFGQIRDKIIWPFVFGWYLGVCVEAEQSSDMDEFEQPSSCSSSRSLNLNPRDGEGG